MLCLAMHEIAKVSMACSILAGQNSIGMALPVLHFAPMTEAAFPAAVGKRTHADGCLHVGAACGSDVAAMKTKAVRDGSST
jgi:alkylation response protein AidB-like acyl-CoA dehydrogenase